MAATTGLGKVLPASTKTAASVASSGSPASAQAPTAPLPQSVAAVLRPEMFAPSYYGWYYKMRFFYILSLLLLSSFALQAQEPPMTFKEVEGSVRGDIWIAAEGRITPSTADDFEKFMKEEDPEAIEIALHSSGGDVESAMQLGILIRKHMLNTHVARTVELEETINEDFSVFERDYKAQCLSSCLWAFLGGISRTVQDGKMSIDLNTPKMVDYAVALAGGTELAYIVMQKYHDDIDPDLYQEELDAYKVRWDANKFKAWQIKSRGEGIVAYSETNDEETEVEFFCEQNGERKFQISTRAYENFISSDWIESLNEHAKSLRALGIEFSKDEFNFEKYYNIFVVTMNLKKGDKFSLTPENLRLETGFPQVMGLGFIERLLLNGEGLQQNANLAFKNCI